MAAPTPDSRRPLSTPTETVRLLHRFGRRHSRVAILGLLGTIGVVVTRLAMPWPLRGLIAAVFPGGETDTMLGAVPPTADPVVWLCGAFLLLAFSSGVAEFVQRVWLTRFASMTVHDLRAAALQGVRGSAGAYSPSDLIARVVGDAARLKANLKGFAVQASQNGLLVVGITVMFLFLAPKLGLLLLASAAAACWVGYRALEGVAETSLRQRETESRYAQRVHHRSLATAEGAEDEALNQESVHKHVRAAKLVNRTTVLGHVVVAAAISIALYVGVQDVRGGDLAPGELFLFVAYALMIQRRAVRLGREVARGGKVVANAARLGALVDRSPASSAELAAPSEIRLESVRVRSGPGHRRRNRLGPIDLRLSRGDRVAVLGGTGDGKSSLLAVLAGAVGADTGRVWWDGEDVTETPWRVRSKVSYLPAHPHLERVSVRRILTPASRSGATDGDVPLERERDLLRRLGLLRLVRRLQSGLDTVVDGATLTTAEQRILCLASIALGDAPVWVLDTPVISAQPEERRRLTALLANAGDRTVIAALPAPCRMRLFSRVVVLVKGKVVFAGSAVAWNSWSVGQPAS